MTKKLDNIFIISDTLGIDLKLLGNKLKGSGITYVELGDATAEIKFKIISTFKLPDDHYGVILSLGNLELKIILYTTGLSITAILCKDVSMCKKYTGTIAFTSSDIPNIIHSSTRDYNSNEWTPN